MKHVDADGVALAKHPVEFRGLLRAVGLVVLFAPVIEPAGPVFAAHVRAVGAKRVEGGETVLRFAGAEVDDGRQFRKRAVGNLLGAVGGVEHVGRHAASMQQLLECLSM